MLGATRMPSPISTAVSIYTAYHTVWFAGLPLNGCRYSRRPQHLTSMFRGPIHGASRLQTGQAGVRLVFYILLTRRSVLGPGPTGPGAAGPGVQLAASSPLHVLTCLWPTPPIEVCRLLLQTGTCFAPPCTPNLEASDKWPQEASLAGIKHLGGLHTVAQLHGVRKALPKHQPAGTRNLPESGRVNRQLVAAVDLGSCREADCWVQLPQAAHGHQQEAVDAGHLDIGSTPWLVAP